MSIQRRFALVCIGPSFAACLAGCGSNAVPARDTASVPSPTLDYSPQAQVAEAPPVTPYAPKRAADGPRYSWQRATPAECAANAPKPAVLTFSGSVGVFPLLSDAEMDRAIAAAEAREALGDEPAAEGKRSSSPDLVVAAMRPRFRKCFSRWLDAKADAEGSVRFALELGCAGNVQAITADDVRGVDEPTLACLFTVVGPAQFDPPANGHATIQVPVVFKSAAR